MFRDNYEIFAFKKKYNLSINDPIFLNTNKIDMLIDISLSNQFKDYLENEEYNLSDEEIYEFDNIKDNDNKIIDLPKDEIDKLWNEL